MLNGVLEKLVENSRRAISEGVYDSTKPHENSGINLVKSIRESQHAPVIAEVKFASPSEGQIRTNADPADIACQMEKGNAVALSVLTQPYSFGGSPENLSRIRQSVNIPILMKDIIVDQKQIEAGANMGADYILLIEEVFESTSKRDELIDTAHSQGLGVILESHKKEKFESSLDSKADIVGINNRNLDTLEISLETTESVMATSPECKVPVISESGISKPEDIRRMRASGADAFLVGTSIMKSDNIRQAVERLVSAI